MSEEGMAPAMDDYANEPGFVALTRPAETAVVTSHQQTAMAAAKRLMDYAISGERVHLEVAQNYIRDL